MENEQNWIGAVDAILEELISAKNSERILHNVLDQLVKLLNCNAAAIVEVNPETEFLEIRNFFNLSWNFCKQYRKTIDSAILRELIWKGEDINIPDRNYAAKVVEQLGMEHSFTSAFVTHLHAFQQPLGFLYVDSQTINYFTSEKQTLVKIFAKVIATTLYIEHLSTKLKRLNRIDEDSGALRFEYYLPFLKENFHRSSRLGETYTLILLDVEKFGSILTLYGMDVTTGLLKEIVSKIKEQLRKYDEICRFGADEFLISLPSTNMKNGLEVANKIYRIFQENTFTEKKIKIDVFLGVVNYPQNALSLNGLLVAAKNALQAAKRMDKKPRIATISTKFD